MSIQSEPAKKPWTSPVLNTTNAVVGNGLAVEPVELSVVIPVLGAAS